MTISAKNKLSFQSLQIIAKNYCQNIGDKKNTNPKGSNTKGSTPNFASNIWRI